MVAWIAEAGEAGRTHTEITRQFFINASHDGTKPGQRKTNYRGHVPTSCSQASTTAVTVAICHR